MDNTLPGIADSGGQPSPIYPEVKKLNHQIRTLGKTLLTLTSTGVYHAGKMPRGGKPVPADAALQLPADQPLMVGFFRQNGAADEFAIVVNWDYTKPIKCDITAGAKVKGILMANAADGTESAPTLTNGTMHLCLEPGEGRLLRLQIE